VTVLTTTHLQKVYGLGPCNYARQSLNQGEKGAVSDGGDSYVLGWGKRTARAEGILAYEAPPEGRRAELPKLSCDCPKRDCYHGLAALWDRALVAEGLTLAEWWEQEKERRQTAKAEEEARHRENMQRWEREAAENEERRRREAAERATAQRIERERLEREAEERRIDEEKRRQAAARRAAYAAPVAQSRPTASRVTFALTAQKGRNPTIVPRIDGAAFRTSPHGHDVYSRSYGAGRYDRGYGYGDPYANARVYEDADGDAGTIRDLIEAMPGDGLERDLSGVIGRTALEMALDAGLLTMGGRPCRRGPDLPVTVAWSMDEAGVQRPRLDWERDEVRDPVSLMVNMNGYLLIRADGEVQAMRDSLPRGALGRLHLIKEIPPEDGAIAAEALAAFPEDQRPKVVRIERRKAAPRRVITLDEKVKEGRRFQRATVSAEYDWGSFAPGEGEAEGRFMEDGALIVTERDMSAEREILSGVDAGQAKVTPGKKGTRIDFGTQEAASVPFKRIELPRLEQSDDWEVRRTSRWSSDLVEWDGDRFDLDFVGDDTDEYLRIEVTADVQGVRSDLIDALIELARLIPQDAEGEAIDEALDRIILPEEHPLRRSGDAGGVVMVPSDILRPVVRSVWRLIHDASMGDGGRLVSRLSLADLPHLGTELRLRTTGSIGRLVAMFQEMASHEPTPVPSSFNPEHTLDHAQQQGLDWMQALWRAGYGGILADEVGVGKTIQLLLQPAALKDQGLLGHQALIAVPKTAIGNWEKEAAKFFPGLTCLVWEGPLRREGIDRLDKVDVVLTTYPAILTDPELNARRWTYIGLDEAQDLRNPTNKTTQKIMAMEAEQKIPASGTPVENRLQDAWTLEEIANPGLLGTPAAFKRQVADPIEKVGVDPHLKRDVQRRFARFLKPFVLRRTRKEAGHNVPDPVWTDHEITIVGPQARLYEFERIAIDRQISGIMRDKGFARGKGEMLTALNRLQQVCCHPLLNKKEYARDMEADAMSAKTDAIVAKARELAAAGKRILVFSRWVEHLGILREALSDGGIRLGQINGKMTTPMRKAAEEAFQAGDLDMLFITLGTGGKSLNLPEADAVFLIDIWWNPQKEVQAVGRTQRRGQEKVVEVHRFLVANSIEIRVRDIQNRKLLISESIYEAVNDNTRWEITESDIHDFLRPLDDYAIAAE
jgi:superfamily II DNA or RNA helicase